MEGTQRRAMAHAEYGRPREPLAHQSIEPRLRGLVHRRGRLIEEEPIGLLDERAGEGDALLLAGESWSAQWPASSSRPASPESPTAPSASRSVTSSTPPAGIG